MTDPGELSHSSKLHVNFTPNQAKFSSSSLQQRLRKLIPPPPVAGGLQVSTQNCSLGPYQLATTATIVHSGWIAWVKCERQGSRAAGSAMLSQTLLSSHRTVSCQGRLYTRQATARISKLESQTRLIGSRLSLGKSLLQCVLPGCARVRPACSDFSSLIEQGYRSYVKP